MTVDPPPSNEACMLGELKLLIDQLDQQTKATMKDSLYRISRHAQVRVSSVPAYHCTVVMGCKLLRSTCTDLPLL